ncbi:MAG: HEPN domain-containing protein [Bacteroidaceae bacterium]|nr:HEPN domain-containing protein [Bacteroidaceae bacterium]
MSLTNEERQIIVNLELEKAQKTFETMELCVREKAFESAANRIYYAVFHAISALLIHEGFSVKSHRGLMALFGEHFVRTGIFTKADGTLFSDLVIMRDNADYNCFYEATEEKLSPYIEPTRQLIEKIKQYIAEKDK